MSDPVSPLPPERPPSEGRCSCGTKGPHFAAAIHQRCPVHYSWVFPDEAPERPRLSDDSLAAMREVAESKPHRDLFAVYKPNLYAMLDEIAALRAQVATVTVSRDDLFDLLGQALSERDALRAQVEAARPPMEREEAVWVKRPHGEPWSWSEPINAIVTASGDWPVRPEWVGVLDITEEALHRLYDCGYAVVKVGDFKGSDQRTITRHAAAARPLVEDPVRSAALDAGVDPDACIEPPLHPIHFPAPLVKDPEEG